MNTIHMSVSLLFESFLKCCGSGIGVCTFNAVLSTLLAVTQHSIFHTVRKVLGCEQSNHKAVMFLSFTQCGAPIYFNCTILYV